MTAPLPPKPAPADQLNDFFAPDQMDDFAKLAAREALERAIEGCDDHTFVGAKYIRAMIEEYR